MSKKNTMIRCLDGLICIPFLLYLMQVSETARRPLFVAIYIAISFLFFPLLTILHNRLISKGYLFLNLVVSVISTLLGCVFQMFEISELTLLFSILEKISIMMLPVSLYFDEENKISVKVIVVAISVAVICSVSLGYFAVWIDIFTV